MERRKARSLLGVVMLVLLTCGACSALPAEWLGALRPQIGAVPTPAVASASVAPTPTVPAGLRRNFIVERDGVRAAVHFRTMPLIAGRPNWLTTTVTNTGSDDLTWYHDGCATTIGGYGTMPDAMRTGADQIGNLAKFKQYALDFPRNGSIYLHIVRPDEVRHGETGCDDIGLADTVKPGQTIRQRMGWNGLANGFLGLPPDGPVTFSLKFEYYGRGGLPHSQSPNNVLDIPAHGWVTGGKSADRLDAPEVVDAALRNPGFRAWAQALSIGYGNDLICWYRPADDIWWVGALFYHDTNGSSVGVFHIALVDPVTGDVREVIDRPWAPSDPLPD
jgi:hypothetical protein